MSRKISVGHTLVLLAGLWAGVSGAVTHPAYELQVRVNPVDQTLAVDAQVQCHGQGYTPSENDLRDMERLQERFGVVLPVVLCRQPRP